MDRMKRPGLIAFVFLFSAGFLSGYETSTSPHHPNSTWDAFLAYHESNLPNNQRPLPPLAEKRDGFHLSLIDNTNAFHGREYDPEIGFYYFRYRQYDPELGWFVQTDPMGYAIIRMEEILDYLSGPGSAVLEIR